MCFFQDKPVREPSFHKPVRTEKAPAQPAPIKLSPAQPAPVEPPPAQPAPVEPSPAQPVGWSAVGLPDEMEMSMEEDDLFRDLPMPEVMFS